MCVRSLGDPLRMVFPVTLSADILLLCVVAGDGVDTTEFVGGMG